MGLTSALYTGLSGLDVNQTRLNVVGNNIANVNTVSFKSSRAQFTPQFYVTSDAGSAPSDTFGGTNPNQQGLGAQVSAIEKDWTPGSIAPTGQPTDMAIDGDGFFILNGSSQHFTRDGSFKLNPANQLVSADGSFVQGFGVDGQGNVVPGTLQNIAIPLGTTTAAKATGSVLLQGNLDSAGAVASGASILVSGPLTTVGGAAPPTTTTLLTGLASAAAPGTAIIKVGDTYTVKGTKGGRSLDARTFTVTATSTVADLNTFLQQGMAIDTTAPTTPPEPTPGATLEADATNPNNARLVLTGNLGAQNAIELTGNAFVKSDGTTPISFADGTNAAGVASNAAGESVHTTVQAYDSLGSPINIDVTAVLETKSDTGNTWRFFAASGDNSGASQALGNGTLTFDTQGNLKSTTGTAINIDRTGTGAKSPLVVKLDFSTLTSLASKSSDMVVTSQDGSPIGTLTTFSIGTDGRIVGTYSNGLSHTVGQVALATFTNKSGLIDKGGNDFVAGADSGVAVISTPQDLGAGTIRSGSLEQSNVDLSKEFVNLIISSTGFSAASKVITTSDQLIQELLSASR